MDSDDPVARAQEKLARRDQLGLRHLEYPALVSRDIADPSGRLPSSSRSARRSFGQRRNDDQAALSMTIGNSALPHGAPAGVPRIGDSAKAPDSLTFTDFLGVWNRTKSIADSFHLEHPANTGMTPEVFWAEAQSMFFELKVNLEAQQAEMLRTSLISGPPFPGGRPRGKYKGYNDAQGGIHEYWDKTDVVNAEILVGALGIGALITALLMATSGGAATVAILGVTITVVFLARLIAAVAVIGTVEFVSRIEEADSCEGVYWDFEPGATFPYQVSDARDHT